MCPLPERPAGHGDTPSATLGLPARLIPTQDSTGNQEMGPSGPLECTVHISTVTSTRGSPPADSCCPQKAGIPLPEVRISEDSTWHQSPMCWLKWAMELSINFQWQRSLETQVPLVKNESQVVILVPVRLASFAFHQCHRREECLLDGHTEEGATEQCCPSGGSLRRECELSTQHCHPETNA